MDPMSLFRLDGEVAIVTGASSGLGAHMAETLVGAGATVVLAARRIERISSLANRLGQNAFAIQCDVVLDHDLEKLVKTVLERFGKIDICVNNAGTSDPSPALLESPDHFRSIIAVNLESVFVLSRLVGAAMTKKGKGSIVNVASVLGLVASGSIPQASYAASKAGVVNLTRELAAQWGRYGVRVNAIAPGWFPSEMTQEMFESDSGREWVAKRCPMGRTGMLAELDGPLLLLASEAGGYMTGETVVVDGGWSII